jgi:hypothetical protein
MKLVGKYEKTKAEMVFTRTSGLGIRKKNPSPKTSYYLWPLIYIFAALLAPPN